MRKCESYSPVIVIGGGVTRVAYGVALQNGDKENDKSLAKGCRSCGVDGHRGGCGPGGRPSDQKRGAGADFVPPPFTWTGFYVGVNAGGIWPSGGRSASLFDPNAGIDGGFVNAGFPGGLGSQSAGFIGGGQAGYNWQTGAFVLGVETDFDGSTLSKSFNNIGAPFAGRRRPSRRATS